MSGMSGMSAPRCAGRLQAAHLAPAAATGPRAFSPRGTGATWRDWIQPVVDAARAIGLDPCATEFFEVPADTLFDLAAYGLPGMYGHWSFGQSRWRHKGEFDAGLATIHELVTHTEPAYAYLLDHNSLSDHIFVMAHVMGHSDFFLRNAFLREARTDMLPLLREAAGRFARYESEQGLPALERLLDLAHALMWHVDPLAQTRPEADAAARVAASGARTSGGDGDAAVGGRGPFADLLGEPPARGGGGPEAVRRRLHAGLAERRHARWGTPCPDPLAFLIAQAPLQAWERDVLQVVREVGLHYRPQIRTKVMNEGWAVRACLKILDLLDLPAPTHLAAAHLHAKVARPDPLRLNPYWLGWRLFAYLEETGHDVAAIAELETDTSFLANWVDAGFVRRERLYNWDAVAEADPATGAPGTVLRESSRAWERVRDRLVAAHFPPIPRIAVAAVNGDGSLRLEAADPQPLELEDARRIVRGIARVWRARAELWASGAGAGPAGVPAGGGAGAPAGSGPAGMPGPAAPGPRAPGSPAGPGAGASPPTPNPGGPAAGLGTPASEEQPASHLVCAAGPTDPDPEEEDDPQ